MRFFVLEPEVAGGLGEHTSMDRSVHPPAVKTLHYVLHGWLGDVLLESFPTYIVTAEAKEALLEDSTGATFDKVEITCSPEFKELYPHRQIPDFAWLRVTGKARIDDFGLAPDWRLVVSERVIDVLKRLGLNNALIEPFAAP